MFSCIFLLLLAGGMFASHLQGWGFDSRLRVCVEFACSQSALGVSSGYSGFLPWSKDMHCRLIGISKLSGLSGKMDKRKDLSEFDTRDKL
ncbi:hypothetical protein QTP70_014503 [Hemibagrus guttatus]|uniref:Secreted protein n=1 Tax=Hemibagrus guttatus TaxID=175788 RepID=A0AAE0RAM3_9TELE|nr:hypothetical protein QTP70_014503 [Hemibagrus guttatus]